MTKNFAIKAELRNESGTGSARALRREGRIPGVIYGGKEAPVHVSLPGKEIFLKSQHLGFKSTIFEVEVDGKKIKALPKELQLNPVSDMPEHIDLQRVEGGEMRVWIPVSFKNREKSPGIKRGGILNIVRREIEFFCDPDSAPEKIVIDLEGQEIGESVHISAAGLPESLKPVLKHDFTIATLVGKGGKSVEEEEAELTEGEEGEEAAEGGEAKEGEEAKAEEGKGE